MRERESYERKDLWSRAMVERAMRERSMRERSMRESMVECYGRISCLPCASVLRGIPAPDPVRGRLLGSWVGYAPSKGKTVVIRPWDPLMQRMRLQHREREADRERATDRETYRERGRQREGGRQGESDR